MAKKDVQGVASGISEEVLAEIRAQSAILDSALKLINQHHSNSKQRSKPDASFGQWVYNMEGLQNWVRHYTERKRLRCPCCKQDSSQEGVRFVCTECLTEYQYHDEL